MGAASTLLGEARHTGGTPPACGCDEKSRPPLDFAPSSAAVTIRNRLSLFFFWQCRHGSFQNAQKCSHTYNFLNKSRPATTQGLAVVTMVAAARRKAARSFSWARRPGDCQALSRVSVVGTSCPLTVYSIAMDN